ncbi:rhamnan synthesis F family protein [Lichenicola cladoniae]|nr:rhamnan synthesis F family protein [Lichenicola cladoniae]
MTGLSDTDRTALDCIGAVAHLRPNRGLDFGAWQDLVATGCTAGATTILLANDSVFGPMQPLEPIFTRMQARDTDVWGMVESREGAWHLQSWFLCFTAAAFEAPAVERVMRLPFHEMSKTEIVLHGELGLGVAITAAGLNWDASWSPSRRRLRRLVPGNPMHLDFLSVMRSGQVPFIKVELLRDNPTAVRWVEQWRNHVGERAIFSADWIDLHLADGGRHTAPRQPRSIRTRLLYAAISRDQPEALRSLVGL